VLWFYPKALTGGRTTEACGFRDLIEQFARLDTVIVGISTDKMPAQEQFVTKNNLPFALLSDEKGEQAYGALGKGSFAARYTFVIDKSGVLRKAYTKVAPANHPKEVLELIKTFK
jgi:peroxiredoxin Q/BCP